VYNSSCYREDHQTLRSLSLSFIFLMSEVFYHQARSSVSLAKRDIYLGTLCDRMTCPVCRRRGPRVMRDHRPGGRDDRVRLERVVGSGWLDDLLRTQKENLKHFLLCFYLFSDRSWSSAPSPSLPVSVIASPVLGTSDQAASAAPNKKTKGRDRLSS
jgi:hypothetical protein